MTARLHVIGAGLAGLAAAVSAVTRGARVVVHEAAPQAGGRCRSFHDGVLGRVIDNGNHLVLSANRDLLDFARQVGGDGALEARPATYPFIDLATGERWTLRPNAGRVPWWVLSPSRRLPRTRASDYLALASLWRAPASATVAGRLGGGRLYERLVEPLSTAILNTEPEAASASLLGAVLAETLGAGGEACRPILAPSGLGEALVAPALAWLRAHGAEVRLGRRLEGLGEVDDAVGLLRFPDDEAHLSAQDQVVLAVPTHAAARLLPGDVPPLASRPILNAHFRLPAPPDAPPLLGLVGGMAQWLFTRGDVVSVTVSAADRWTAAPAEDLARALWADAAFALDLRGAPLPPWRILKERRATLAHSPGQEILRPGPRTRLRNLWLAGDWTATGLPCTLEGAVRSGRRAADLALAPLGRA